MDDWYRIEIDSLGEQKVPKKRPIWWTNCESFGKFPFKALSHS